MARVSRQGGFTLIEIMIVIVIVAIISAVAVMSFSGLFHSSSRLTEQLQIMVKSGQEQALLVHRSVRMKISGKDLSWQIMTLDPKAWLNDGAIQSTWQSWQGGQLDHPGFFSKPVTVKLMHHGAFSEATPSAQIQFMPDTTVTPFEIIMMDGTTISECWRSDQYGVVSSCLDA